MSERHPRRRALSHNGESVEADIHQAQRSIAAGENLPENPAALDRKGGWKGLWKPVALFYAIACGFAWIAWLSAVLGPDGLKLTKTHVSFPVFACIGTLGPFLACFITHRVCAGNWRAVRLLPRGGLKLGWLLFGPLLVFFCFFFVFPALISKGGPSAWHWHPGALIGIWVPMFNYNLFGGPLFEEFGWRGFLQPRLQQMLPPWIAAICVGFLWAAWHIPLFLVSFTSASPLVFLFILVGLSVIMAFAFNGSGQAVVVAILMHSAFNASGSFVSAFLGNGPTREHPSAELFIGFSFLLVAVAAAILTRGRLLAPSK
jgi:uncharacterized protein